MPNTQGLAIFKKLYELIIVIYQYVRLFPKQEKFVLGERIENASINLLEGIIIANQKKEKLSSLVEVSVKLDILRIFIRLAKDLRLIDLKKYEILSSHIQEIGKMLGGWIRYEKEKIIPKENSLVTAGLSCNEDLSKPL